MSITYLCFEKVLKNCCQTDCIEQKFNFFIVLDFSLCNFLYCLLSMSSSKNGLDLPFEEVTVSVGVWNEDSDNFELFDESIITKMDKMVEKSNTNLE